MGREIRQVPMDWQHPKDDRGYIPMHNKDWKTAVEEWEANGCNYEDAPDLARYRPVWGEDVKLGFCLYETVSEGKPVSPIFATKDEVIAWCREHKYGAMLIADLIKFDFCFSGVMIGGYSEWTSDAE